jgi:hypothetical protein
MPNKREVQTPPLIQKEKEIIKQEEKIIEKKARLFFTK